MYRIFFFLLILIPFNVNATLLVKNVWFNSSASATPPKMQDGNWKQVSLPDNWTETDRQVSHPAWYAYEVNTKDIEANQLWGLYLNSVLTNAQVFVGNEYMGSGGRITKPYARNWNRPLFFTLPTNLLRQHKIIYIRLFPKQRGYAAITPFMIGPHSSLYPQYQSAYFWKITMSQIVSVVLFAIAVFYCVLWFNRKKDVSFGFFSIATFSWAIYNFNYFIQEIPLPGKVWDWLAAYSALGWFLVMMCLFFHRKYSIHRPRFEKALLITTVCLDFLMLSLPADIFYFFANYIWDTYLLVVGIYATSLVVRYSFVRPNVETNLFLAATLILTLCGIHDYYVQISDSSNPHIMHLAAPFFIIMIGWALLKRFINALNEVEELNQDMEKRVQVAAHELENTYKKISELEKEKALSHERDRIMRDIHDSVGGQLVSMISMVQNETIDNNQLIEEIRVTLDDLRLIIESCDPVDSDLLTVLGMLRSRIEHRLIANNIELQWNVEEIPKLQDLDPEKVLHILRIVQEAITNVIKHTNADVLNIETGQLKREFKNLVFISIRDNGKGFEEGQKSSGRGFNNMKRRASEIGGSIEIQTNNSGTSVTLYIPMEAEAAYQ